MFELQNNPAKVTTLGLLLKANAERSSGLRSAMTISGSTVNHLALAPNRRRVMRPKRKQSGVKGKETGRQKRAKSLILPREQGDKSVANPAKSTTWTTISFRGRFSLQNQPPRQS
jgi:hypothetical protein